jgi:ornithine cyclodeaminase
VKVLIVSQAEVATLLPMKECIDLMAEALSTLAREEAVMPLRSIMWLPESIGALAAMPSYLPHIGMMGIKVISVFPRNRGTGLESHQGAVLLFEAERGRLLAIVDATAITAIRTAAVSGAATRALANIDAGDLAILGSGTQAGTHLEAMMLVRSVLRVRVWSPSGENAQRFAERQSARRQVRIEVEPTARDAVEGADLVCTTTSSRQPILHGEWLAPGAHVNAIGAVGRTARELDTTAIARARLFVDLRESAENEAGEFVLAREEGAIGAEHVLGEIGELLIGRVNGRVAPEDITVFRGVGLAIEDLAAAHHVYRKAMSEGFGKQVDLGGVRPEQAPR